MLKIELDKIDELHNISEQLNTIIFLQNLVVDWACGTNESEYFFEKAEENAIFYLLKCAEECAVNFKKLICSEDFVLNT